MISSTAMLSPDTKGSTPLWLVFWVYGVAVSHVLFGIVLWCYAHGSTLLLTSSLVVLLIYSVWISRSIWINADNVRDRRFGNIARHLTVAWSINALMVSAFLLLSHVSGERLPMPF